MAVAAVVYFAGTASGGGPFVRVLAKAAEIAGQNPKFRRIWESYRPYRTELYQWFRISENSFDNFAFPAGSPS